MDRVITLDASGDYISKDEQIIRFSEFERNNNHRMRDVLKWARDNGFTARRTYRRESPKRAWTLRGTGLYEGWSIQCLNRSKRSVNADWYQERGYAVFYNQYQICNYFPSDGQSFAPQKAHLIDLLLDGVMPALIKDRPRLMNRYADHTPSAQVVLKRAA